MSSLNNTVNQQFIQILEEQVKITGNNTCAECGARGPRWTSTNLGIYICLGCSGMHRSLGTNYSKVKSISLDVWSKNQVEV
jgi:hypothetical protein